MQAASAFTPSVGTLLVAGTCPRVLAQPNTRVGLIVYLRIAARGPTIGADPEFRPGVGDHEKCTEMITKSAQASGVSQP